MYQDFDVQSEPGFFSYTTYHANLNEIEPAGSPLERSRQLRLLSQELRQQAYLLQNDAKRLRKTG